MPRKQLVNRDGDRTKTGVSDHPKVGPLEAHARELVRLIAWRRKYTEPQHYPRSTESKHTNKIVQEWSKSLENRPVNDEFPRVSLGRDAARLLSVVLHVQMDRILKTVEGHVQTGKRKRALPRDVTQALVTHSKVTKQS